MVTSGRARRSSLGGRAVGGKAFCLPWCAARRTDRWLVEEAPVGGRGAPFGRVSRMPSRRGASPSSAGAPPLSCNPAGQTQGIRYAAKAASAARSASFPASRTPTTRPATRRARTSSTSTSTTAPSRAPAAGTARSTRPRNPGSSDSTQGAAYDPYPRPLAGPASSAKAKGAFKTPIKGSEEGVSTRRTATPSFVREPSIRSPGRTPRTRCPRASATAPSGVSTASPAPSSTTTPTTCSGGFTSS